MVGFIFSNSGDFVDGTAISASKFTTLGNEIKAALDATTGHTHGGGAGEGAPIPLATGTTGTLPINRGGTNSSTASAARTALGLAIGTDVQAYDAGLLSIAGLTTAADRMLYTTALDTYAVTTLTAFARTLLDDADAATMRGTLALGSLAVQNTVSTSLVDNDAITYAKIQNVSATDRLLGRSTAGAGDIEEITCTSFARTILDDVDAATVRATIAAAGTGVTNTFSARQDFNAYVDFEDGIGAKITTTSSTSYNVATTDLIVLLSSTSARSAVLPAPGSQTRRYIYIKDVAGNAATNNITVTVSGGSNIDGATSYVINDNYGGIAFICNGSQWFTM